MPQCRQKCRRRLDRIYFWSGHQNGNFVLFPIEIALFTDAIYMPNPYSLDLRARIVKDYDVGVPVEDLVAHYAVSRSWIYSLLQLRRDTGNITPHPYRRGRKQKLAPHEQTVRQLVGEHPDATLSDFCEMLSAHVSVSPAALCNFLRHLKITRKKRLFALSNGIEKMSSKNEQNGSNSKKSLTSKDSYSSTKLGRKRT